MPRRQGNVFGSHTYADDGVYTITVTITDSGGLEISESLEVTVDNLLPIIDVVGTQTTHAGDLLSITDIATFTDAGFNNPLASPATTESFTYSINWGDGAALQVGTPTIDSAGSALSPTTGSFNTDHTYLSEGVFNVSVTITDDDNGAATDNFTVIVFAAVEATDDNLETDAQTPLELPAAGVLTNDSGDLIQVVAVEDQDNLVGEPFILDSGATVTLDEDGRLLYDPTLSAELAALLPGEFVNEQINYTVSDGRGAFDVGTITVRVSGTNNNSSTASINARLVLSPTATTTNNQVAELPPDEAWIDEWRTFWVELWLRVEETNSTGIESANTSIAYNTDYFSVQTIAAGAAFANDFTATPDDSLGQVDIAATSDANEPLGVGQYALLARIQFTSTSGDAGVPLGLDQPGPIAPVEDNWLDLGGASQVTLIGGTAINTVEQQGPATALWPLLYDLDDDRRIGFGDLSILASVFLREADFSPAATKSDFDASGRVDFGDLSLLAANFLRDPTSGEILFPSGFPDVLLGTSVVSQSSPPVIASALAESSTTSTTTALNVATFNWSYAWHTQSEALVAANSAARSNTTSFISPNAPYEEVVFLRPT